ncbi:MAG: DMT family transporter [Acidobacteria bacterium]|jgi:drug/metabolite transporter (DMT)-like permease|nr:DMT family transporter [Acidobacteriota bacterium]
MQRLKLTSNDLLMLLVVTIWALNLSLVKIALVEIPPLPYNGIRLLLAAAILLALLLLTEKNLRLRRQDVPKIVMLSFTGYALYQYLFILGIDMTSASNTAVIFGSTPIMVSLLSSFFKHEKITPLGWLGIIMGFIGIYLVVSGRSGGFALSHRTWKGDLLLFAAVFLWAHYSVSARPLLKIYSPLKFTTVTMGLGALMFFPFSLAPLRRLAPGAVSAKAWLCLLYSGVIALSLALVLWFFSVRRVGNSQTAVYSNLQPVLAMVFAWLLLEEKASSSLLLGAAVIFVGIYFTRRGRAAAPVAADHGGRA